MAADGHVRDRLYRRYVSTHVDPASRSGLRTGIRVFSVLRYLPPDRYARILDIGCGSGDLVEAVAARGYQNVAGVDVSVEQVQRAHELGRSRVEQGDVFTFLADHRDDFDVILAVDVLEHLTRAEVLRLLDDVRVALAPGGRFVAQVPNGSSPFFGNYAYGDLTHESVYTARSLRQVCLTAGFSEFAAFPVGPTAHGMVSTIRVLLFGLFTGFFKLALAAETGVLRGHLVTQNIICTARKPD